MDSDDIDFELFRNVPSKNDLRLHIERLGVSADAKALLNNLLDLAVEVSGRVVSAGRQILSFIFDMMKRFPNAAFGVIVALVVSSLIASIPLLGAVLAPLMTPLLLAFGLAAGALADLKDGPMRSRVAMLEEHFANVIDHG